MSKKEKHEQIIPITTKDYLFKHYVVEGLKDHVSKNDIRLALIDVMRKEVFQQMMNRMKVTDPKLALKTPKNEEIVKNIAIQARNKWASLVRECNKWTETLNMLKEDDLKEIWADEEIVNA